MVVKHCTTVRAVAYYRMSTAQQEASIPEQKEWARRAAQTHGVEVVAEFQDDGISGSEIEHRPGLAQLLAFCAAHNIQAILCWDPDRLSRADSIKTAAVLNTLMQAGVTRLLTHEGWIDLEDDVDRLLFHIKQDMSRAAYSKSISRNVTRSAVERAQRGLWVAGRPPYGYRIGDDGHLVLGDPAMVETVRWIFRQYATTADSCGDLCRKLVEMGAPPPPPRKRKDALWGGRWQRGIINDMLACRAYLGEIVWNVSGQGKYSKVTSGEVRPVKGKRGLVRNACEDWIIVPDAHPAIIDQETFDACQRKLAETCRGGSRCRNTPLPGGGNWALSGMLYCGMCGGRMVGCTERRTYKGKLYVYRYYTCKASQRLSAGACRKNAVKQEVVLDEVARLIQESFTEPDRLAELREAVQVQAGVEEEDSAATRKRLLEAIDTLVRQVARCRKNMALAEDADTLRHLGEQAREWEAERADLARELARLEASAEVQAQYAQHVVEALSRVRRLQEIVRTAPANEVRDALAGLVERITLFFDYGPPRKNGFRPAILTSFEVRMREEAAGLLGDELRRSARSTA